MCNCEAFCPSFILMVLKIYFFGMEQCHKMLWFNTVHLFNFSLFISILSVPNRLRQAFKLFSKTSSEDKLIKTRGRESLYE